MAKKIPNFTPRLFDPKRPRPLGSQPVPTAPQQLKDRNQNAHPINKPDKGKKDK